MKIKSKITTKSNLTIEQFKNFDFEESHVVYLKIFDDTTLNTEFEKISFAALRRHIFNRIPLHILISHFTSVSIENKEKNQSFKPYEHNYIGDKGRCTSMLYLLPSSTDRIIQDLIKALDGSPKNRLFKYGCSIKFKLKDGKTITLKIKT